MRIEPIEGGVRLSVHVQPRASRTEVAGEHGGAIKIRLAAPAVEGAANRELIEFLSSISGVAKRYVRISRGERSRSKVVEILGVEADRVRRALGVEER